MSFQAFEKKLFLMVLKLNKLPQFTIYNDSEAFFQILYQGVFVLKL
jgi:hypothetical protein